MVAVGAAVARVATEVAAVAAVEAVAEMELFEINSWQHCETQCETVRLNGGESE